MILSRASKALAVVAAAMTITSSADASIIYFAEDNCDGDCTSSPQSNAVQHDFLSKIMNPEVESFESFENGYYTELTSTKFTQAGRVTLLGPMFEIKEGGGGYGTAPVRGAKFMETIAGIKFHIDFEQPIAAFGFYGTDVGDVQGELQITTSLNGGASESHIIPLSSTTTSGDIIFWGIIDETTFDKIEFDLIHSTEVDLFGFDEFTVAGLQQVATGSGPTRLVFDAPTPPGGLLPPDDSGNLPPGGILPPDDSGNLPPPPPGDPLFTGGASGDPHFRTWAGEKFDFHGECDLVLLSNPGFRNNLGLGINIRTKRSRQWSYIESVAIHIGDDIAEVMGGQDADNFWVNKVSVRPSSDNKRMTIAGYSIVYKELNSKSRQFVIDLRKGVKIEMKTWNKYVSVRVIGANEDDFNGALGLMGTFPRSIRLARDNKTVVDDVNDFGKEWQVLASEEMLFHKVDGPQAPEACEIPSSKDMRRRLGESNISQKDAEIACAQVATEDFDLCVFDVMASNDRDIAGAY